MAKKQGIGKAIIAAALEIIATNPGGIRYSQLVSRLKQQHPEWNSNFINGCVWNLDAEFPDKVSKPSRGLFMPARVSQEIESKGGSDSASFGSGEKDSPEERKAREKDFYKPFSEWLKSFEGLTAAEVLGGRVLRGRWATPDVIGTYRSQNTDHVKFETELV